MYNLELIFIEPKHDQVTMNLSDIQGVGVPY